MTLRKTKKKGANSKTIELGNKNERKQERVRDH